jgi:hypothetical protein
MEWILGKLRLRYEYGRIGNGRGYGGGIEQGES